MKKITVVLSVVALAIYFGFATLNAHETNNASTTATPAVTAQKVQNSNDNFYNMGRGLTNVATCWMEVFRCMIYRNSQAPFWGMIAGAVEGSGLTAVRAFTGVTDILFVGFEPGNIFEPRFAEFVWQSPWIPEPKLQYKAPKLRQD